MMRTRRSTPVGVAVALATLLAIAAYQAWEASRGPSRDAPDVAAPAPSSGTAPSGAGREPAAPPSAPVTPTATPSAARTRSATTSDDALVMRDQRIHDERGRVIYEGDVDLAPVFARIAAGTRDPHRNDGATFANREGRLPRQPRGYYTEWVVRTRGVGGVGPQRLVTGRDGDAWYTPDHYETFVRVRPPS